MLLIDPNSESTWKNNPAPRLDQSFHDALKPMGCRIVWGQERMKFQRGKERLAYIDRRIPPIETTQHVLKRPSLIDESGKTIQWEKKVVDGAPAVIPEGWLYELELVSLEFIGDQLFYIEQFVPADRLGDTPESWESIRYEDWDDPEIGFVEHCDVLGPFPSEGQWRAQMVVGEPYSYPMVDDMGQTIQGNYLRFRMPGTDTLEALKEQMCLRENTKLASPKQRGKDRFYDYNRTMGANRIGRRVEAHAFFKDLMSSTRTREALLRDYERSLTAGPTTAFSVPGIPDKELARELTFSNRHQRRMMKSLQRKAA